MVARIACLVLVYWSWYLIGNAHGDWAQYAWAGIIALVALQVWPRRRVNPMERCERCGMSADSAYAHMECPSRIHTHRFEKQGVTI